MKEKTREENLVKVISGEMNAFGFKKDKFCEEMSKEHRYLQSEFTELCISWLEKCAEMYDKGRYDGRNEVACKFGKDFVTWNNNR